MPTPEGKEKTSNTPFALLFQVKSGKQSPKRGVLLGQAQQSCPAGLNMLILINEGTT